MIVEDLPTWAHARLSRAMDEAGQFDEPRKILEALKYLGRQDAQPEPLPIVTRALMLWCADTVRGALQDLENPPRTDYPHPPPHNFHPLWLTILDDLPRLIEVERRARTADQGEP